MKNILLALAVVFLIPLVKAESLDIHPIKTEVQSSLPSDKQMKREALLTAKKWVCLDVSKKRLTKKLDFEVGNECNFSIDKKYSFKNNNYDYANGNWKLDGKLLYFFYSPNTGENRVETAKFKVIKLTENEMVLKRLEKPKGKLTFK
ncbi:MAG: hypothetical protein N4A46_16625 [Schleiferiaceae bacterium]|jgi:hypothetical protein|nr:hypothetical protein [Schleiferiaceae bacterium]